jgi:hypothetical protein
LVAAHALALAAQSSTWLRPAAIITYHYKVNPKNNLKRKKKNKTKLLARLMRRKGSYW